MARPASTVDRTGRSANWEENQIVADVAPDVRYDGGFLDAAVIDDVG
jgi:hypothetical protein